MNESFDDVRMFAQTIVADCDIPLLDRMKMAHENEIVELQRTYEQKVIDLQVAHEREIKLLHKAEYSRGYEDGQHSMDAEHYAVALRLMHMPLDEDSYGNLSQIASAIWHSDFGWTQGACRALRDELVRLMGGVSALPTYDVLGNERQKAIAELRNASLETGSAIKKLAHALGVKWNPDNTPKSMGLLRDRLIHLIGGSECNFSGVESYMDAMGGKSNPAETSNESTDHVTLATPSPEDGTCPNDDRTCPNPVQGASITDELREWHRTTPYLGKGSFELCAIADRIDEQFKRVCEQQETVLRSTVERMADENLTVKDERDHLRRQRDELQKKLDAMREVLDGR